MEKKTVYYVTGFELGWDCVVGIYDPDEVSYEDLQEEYPEDSYYINTMTVKTKI